VSNTVQESCSESALAQGNRYPLRFHSAATFFWIMMSCWPKFTTLGKLKYHFLEIISDTTYVL